MKCNEMERLDAPTVRPPTLEARSEKVFFFSLRPFRRSRSVLLLSLEILPASKFLPPTPSSSSSSSSSPPGRASRRGQRKRKRGEKKTDFRCSSVRCSTERSIRPSTCSSFQVECLSLSLSLSRFFLGGDFFFTWNWVFLRPEGVVTAGRPSGSEIIVVVVVVVVVDFVVAFSHVFPAGRGRRSGPRPSSSGFFELVGFSFFFWLIGRVQSRRVQSPAPTPIAVERGQSSDSQQQQQPTTTTTTTASTATKRKRNNNNNKKTTIGFHYFPLARYLGTPGFS